MATAENELLLKEKFDILLNVINKGNSVNLENAIQHIEKDVNVNDVFSYKDSCGKSLFDYVSILGKSMLVKSIVENHVNPNIMAYAGYTALHYAAAWGNTETTKKIVEMGGDIFKKTFNNERPREIAKRYGHEECVAFLDWQESKLDLEAIITRMTGYLSQPDKVKLLAKDEKLTCQNACSEKKAWIQNTKNASTFDYRMHNQQLSHIFGNFFKRFEEADLAD